LTAFRRLVHLSASSGPETDLLVPAAASAGSATISDVDMLVAGPQTSVAMETGAGGVGHGRLLSMDDAVLLASALARHLGPLLEDLYLVSRYVLPTFQVRLLSMFATQQCMCTVLDPIFGPQYLRDQAIHDCCPSSAQSFCFK
jgi:hypothetical protein